MVDLLLIIHGSSALWIGKGVSKTTTYNDIENWLEISNMAREMILQRGAVGG